MKTLIISGTVSKSELTPNMLCYDVYLFGQTNEHPTCVYITSKKIECSGFYDMQDIARDIYAKYFDTNLFNIISLEHIRII